MLSPFKTDAPVRKKRPLREFHHLRTEHSAICQSKDLGVYTFPSSFDNILIVTEDSRILLIETMAWIATYVHFFCFIERKVAMRAKQKHFVPRTSTMKRELPVVRTLDRCPSFPSAEKILTEWRGDTFFSEAGLNMTRWNGTNLWRHPHLFNFFRSFDSQQYDAVLVQLAES